MTAKPKLALLLLIALLAGILCLFLTGHPGHKQDQATSHPATPDHGPSSPRPKDDINERIKQAIAEYKKSERPNYSDAAPYALSPAEVEKFLQARGHTAASLYFVLLCTEGRKLDDIAALPDSPLKFQILATYTTDKNERLAMARKYLETDPGNKLAHLMLSHTLSELDLADEAAAALRNSSSTSDIHSSRDDIAAEFKAACDILGEDRGYQMLELHWYDYAVNLGHQTAHAYITSLDPAAFIHDGKADATLLLQTMDDYYRDIGFDEDRRRNEVMMSVRSAIAAMNSDNTITNATFEIDRLNRELDAEFIAGFKRATAFDKLTPAQRHQRLAEQHLDAP
ncbi:hypothetical protein [Luteolibacter soli]|uniref:Uncharacterized protein n=1 Tax=Luteolibacter soli TaxID=3135280 RepID=A0ABU9AVD1_9BACT